VARRDTFRKGLVSHHDTVERFSLPVLATEGIRNFSAELGTAKVYKRYLAVDKE